MQRSLVVFLALFAVAVSAMDIEPVADIDHPEMSDVADDVDNVETELEAGSEEEAGAEEELQEEPSEELQEEPSEEEPTEDLEEETEVAPENLLDLDEAEESEETEELQTEESEETEQTSEATESEGDQAEDFLDESEEDARRNPARDLNAYMNRELAKETRKARALNARSSSALRVYRRAAGVANRARSVYNHHHRRYRAQVARNAAYRKACLRRIAQNMADLRLVNVLIAKVHQLHRVKESTTESIEETEDLQNSEEVKSLSALMLGADDGDMHGELKQVLGDIMSGRVHKESVSILQLLRQLANKLKDRRCLGIAARKDQAAGRVRRSVAHYRRNYNNKNALKSRAHRAYAVAAARARAQNAERRKVANAFRRAKNAMNGYSGVHKHLKQCRIHLSRAVKRKRTHRRRRHSRKCGLRAARSNVDVCCGTSTNFKPYGSSMYVDINARNCGFIGTPTYFSTMDGISSHWTATGMNAHYKIRSTGMRVYVRVPYANRRRYRYKLQWCGFGRRRKTAAATRSNSVIGTCCGSTNTWKLYARHHMYADTNMDKCQFLGKPDITTAMTGSHSHWHLRGMSATYGLTNRRFRTYIANSTPSKAHKLRYVLHWCATGRVRRNSYCRGVRRVTRNNGRVKSTRARMCCGMVHHPRWKAYHSTGMYLRINTSRCRFSSRSPVTYFASMSGNSHHWENRGINAVYTARHNRFDHYSFLHGSTARKKSIQKMVKNGRLSWKMQWCGIQG